MRVENGISAGTRSTASTALESLPELRELATAARARLGARLRWLVAGPVELGHKPGWWQDWPAAGRALKPAVHALAKPFLRES